MDLPETLPVCFPVYRARAVYEHRTVFSAHTHTEQKASEEIFSEFEKKCIGLESSTTPLTQETIGRLIDYENNN